MGVLVCSETSVNKYQHTLCNKPEERGPPPLREADPWNLAPFVNLSALIPSPSYYIYRHTIKKKIYLVVSHVTLNNSCSRYSVNSYRQYEPHTPSDINLRQPGYLCFIRSRNWATLTDSIIAFLMSSMICIWQKKNIYIYIYRNTRNVWFVAHFACVSSRVWAFLKWIYVTALLHIP